MLPQQIMIERLRQICQSDERVVASLLYGSFTTNEGDAFSDIECALFFKPESLPTLDKKAWVEQIAPTVLFFADRFGHFTALFDNLVRGEFHFDSAEAIEHVAGWKGNAWFPSASAAVLVDRTGALSTAVLPLVGAPPERDTPQSVESLIPNFVNLIVFGMNILRRGEWARSLDLLSLIHQSLLWMVRLVEGQTAHWPTPSKRLEQDLSATSYSRFVACSASLDATQLERAYHNCWQWGQELSALLSERHQLENPIHVFTLVTQHYFDRSNSHA